MPLLVGNLEVSYIRFNSFLCCFSAVSLVTGKAYVRSPAAVLSLGLPFILIVILILILIMFGIEPAIHHRRLFGDSKGIQPVKTPAPIIQL